MKKVVKYGWIGKNWPLNDVIFICDDGYYSTLVSVKHGNKNVWEPSDWPPRKVRIIMEENI